jgi:hypothetical protein
MSIKRVFLIVLDSVGIGELPDAKLYQDEGSNTFRSCYQTGLLQVPNMEKLGIFHVDGMDYAGKHEPDNMPASARLKERWEAWRRGNVMTSEMESATIFVISSIRNCRASSIMAYSDMRRSVEVACEALRILIKEDNNKGMEN